MRPKSGDTHVQIPITFDGAAGGGALRTGIGTKILWFIIIVVFYLMTSFVVIVAGEGFWRIGYPILGFIGATMLIRYAVFNEGYYRKKRRKFIENNYMFSHNVFWNIYDISKSYPHFVYYANGLKGIFVLFDKDVVVGKEGNNEFSHYEELADAYQQAQKRGIELMHIDYMDTVGKDTRLESLFKISANTKNEDLKRELTKIYDYIELKMNRVYSSYDVYVFFFNGREDVFWDDLDVVISYFLKANYMRARILDRDGISDLVKSLMNIDNFSINRASDKLFNEMNKTQFIKPIWVQKNGEVKVLNKTAEELAEQRRVSQSERAVKARRKMRGLFSRKKEEDIDLFD